MSNGEDRLQDRHEAGDLTEAAAAHHLGMHHKALLTLVTVGQSHGAQPAQGELWRDGPELVSPTPPLPLKAWKGERGLPSGVLGQSRQHVSIFCRGPRVSEAYGKGQCVPFGHG